MQAKRHAQPNIVLIRTFAEFAEFMVLRLRKWTSKDQNIARERQSGYGLIGW
jgi:hypothetical protein